MTVQRDTLPEYTDDKRLQVYKLITSACTHLYSKAKLQKEVWNEVAPLFAELAKHDPIFLAHLTAWSMRQDHKDLKALAVFFNTLSDADGTPFFPGAKKNKPNLRQVSLAILQQLDPHLALRICELANMRFSVPGLLNDSRHFPTSLRKAYAKYLRYREENPDMLWGIKRAGLSRKLRDLYRLSHVCPSDEAASILKWEQKDGRKLVMQNLPDFAAMNSKEIAEKLLESRLSPQIALSVLPKEKITTEVAKALLTNATGNQSIILYNWFNRNGFMDVKSIKELFKEKVKTSTTAVDRVDTLTKDADEADRKELAQVRSEKRKATARIADIKRIFMHIDQSGSMSAAIEFAKDKASIIAECVNDPKDNFRWGLFGSVGRELKLPDGFTKEDFHATLYGVHTSGSTDCIALYPKARAFGAEVDVYITDQGHNIGAIQKRINEFHAANPSAVKPRAAVIVNFGPATGGQLEHDLRAVGIPVALLMPNALNESALVAQSVRNAMVGELAIIEEILDVPLPSLPNWWNEVKANRKVDAPEAV